MEWQQGMYRFSPSDLTQLLGCAHASALSRKVARGERARAFRGSAYAELVFRKGDEHEQAYLASLRAAGRVVVDVGREGGWDASAARTAKLMRTGVDVIYQGVLVVGAWRGLADFVERTEAPSALGGWSYEAVDTKLARVEARPSHALQLCFYSDGIAAVQGRAPERAHLELGSGVRESLRLREIAAYWRRAKGFLEQAAIADAATVAYPCEQCTYCSFARECSEAWRASDHLTLVADVHREHVEHLTGAGVSTRRALAALGPATAIPALRPATLDGLRQQARLQVAAEEAGTIPFQMLAAGAGRGLALLPDPSPGDVIFDIEGDPYFTAASDLTFLFGVLLAEADGWRYEAFWAHSPGQERVAFERLVDLVHARLAVHPDMHVYHYSAAEPSVLKRLMARHATRELEVDGLLRRGVLVDLYAVLRSALRAGVESYSLKQTEKLAGFRRSAEFASGSDAVLAYERYLAVHEVAELEEIARYNREDCDATLALRGWLLALRPADVPALEPKEEAERTPEAIAHEALVAELRSALTAGEVPGSARLLAGELLEYHRREARPGWWRWFAWHKMDEAELIRDPEAIGALEPIGPPRPLKRRSWEQTFAFPPQGCKAGPGDTLHDPEDDASYPVAAIDAAAGTITLRAQRLEHGHPRALIPGQPISTSIQRDALVRVATSIRDAPGTFPAIEAILARDVPRLTGRPTGVAIQTTILAEQQALAHALDRSYLVVQGPPGTGKTFTGARLITSLLAAGKRVGVMALGHKAINNLLAEVERAATEREHAVTFRGARMAGASPSSRVPEGGQITNVDDHKALLGGGFDLVAGTSWLLARAGWERQLDYLVIDEAGQLSLADAIACATAATNVILLGDPLQLPQVSQATHPVGTGASVLEHLLGDAPTVPPDRGVFLTETWRMHPDVCRFISDELYEGRLTSEAGCARQGTAEGTGIRYLPVVHRARSTHSPEEAAAIAAVVDGLIGRDHADRHGVTHPIAAADIMVVAPYTAQVRLLRQRLPADVRVGTVDAFQGQEAPIVVFSMATSSGDDLPRDIAFLFSRNRLNVAISRARCLAILCCSPALLDTRASTIDDMRLVSTLCALVEAAGEVWRPPGDGLGRRG